MKHSLNVYAIAAVAAAMLAGAGGPGATCHAAGKTAAVAAPSFSEVDRVLKLDNADAAVVKAALAQWQNADSAPRSGQPGGARRQELRFVATVAPSLDDAQLTDLVNLLVTRREAVRDQSHSRRRAANNGEDTSAMAKELGLTRRQQRDLKALRQDTRARADAQRKSFAGGGLNEDQLRDALQAIHADARAKMATILSSDQMTKLDAMRDERFSQAMDRRTAHAGERADARVAWLDQALELTDKQSSRVKAALVSMNDANDAALKGIENKSLTREEALARMRDANRAFAESMKGILNDAQAHRMQILKPLLKGRWRGV